MSLLRKLVFQPDICQWLLESRTQISLIRKQRYKLEKGLIGSFRDARDFFSSKPNGESDSPNESAKKDSSPQSTSMDQYFESEELIKRMKWKRVTWEENADYTSFARRILNNDRMFKNTKAFSFMSLHLMKDPLTSNQVNIQRGAKVAISGDLCNMFLQERTINVVQKYIPCSATTRLSPFVVDWVAGSVKILDTASPQEMLTFLTTVAPRVQAVQLKMEAQQERQSRDIELVRVRVGATLKFNEFNTSFWDDPRRKTDPAYINPDDLEEFLKGLLNSAFLFRWFLKGTEIRVVPPGHSYYADIERNEIHIPANFSDFNWLAVHSRFQGLEKFLNQFRRFWWFWFSVAIVIVGDVELL